MVIKIGIIGAGVAGLGAAYRLEQLFPSIKIILFDKSDRIGGRIFSKVYKNNVVDVGANFLTFDMLKNPQQTVSLILNQFNRNLVKISKPLFLYDQNVLRLGDHQSDKYSYKNGIEQLSNQLIQKLKFTQLILNSKISEIKNDQKGWQIMNNGQIYRLDMIIIAAPIPEISDLLKNYIQQNKIYDIQYSRQITASFILKKQVDFSCILFKNHQITFICSHQQKTGCNIVNIQMNHKFSQQYWKQSDHTILQLIIELIPKNIPIQLERQQLQVIRWYPSLRNSNSIIQDIPKIHLYFCGDSKLSKSRVVSSLESGILSAQKIFQHLQSF